MTEQPGNMERVGADDRDEGSEVSALRRAASDTTGIVGLVVFVVVVLVGALALVNLTDDDEVAGSTERADVVMPSESETFVADDDTAGDQGGAGSCAPGRVDLLSADRDDVRAVRGLRQADVADLVIANRDLIEDTSDLVRIGISDAQVSRVLLSRQACIGEVLPDASLPGPVCQEFGLDINTAFLSELSELEGIDEEQAELLLEARPFDDIDDIVAVEGVSERTVTWLALNDTCLRQVTTSADLLDGPPPCSERIDLDAATMEETMTVRGLHQSEAAELIVSRQGEITSVDDLLELGLDPSRIGRLLASHEACFGEFNPDTAMPGVCGPNDLNVNDATVLQLLDVNGIPHDTADLLISHRPFTDADELVLVPGMLDSTLTWLSVGGTCLAPPTPADDICAPGRIDVQTAALDELVQMRGSRRPSVASTLFENREQVDGLESLLELEIEPAVAGRIISSRQMCFGDRLPELDLPDHTCGATSLDLNEATVADLVELEGLTHLQVDLLIADRPLLEPADLLDVSGLTPETIAALAQLDTCLSGDSPAEVG